MNLKSGTLFKDKYAIFSMLVWVLLAALIAYEVYFVYSLYKRINAVTDLPSNIHTVRIDQNAYTAARARYEDTKKFVPNLNIKRDPFNSQTPITVSQ